MKRSKWKGPFLKKFNSIENFIILSRNCEITSTLVGLTCKVHSGKTLVKLRIIDKMIGHKIGEFVPTRKKFIFKKKTRG